MHVRAMFRILGFTRSESGRPLFKLCATYSTRNGEPCEENKSFSRWTPSGEMELVHEPNEVLSETLDYVYLDIYRADNAPEKPDNAIRVSMFVSRFEIDASGGPSVYSKLYPGAGIRGSLSMQVTNFHPAVIGLLGLAPGESPRAVVVDISRVP